MLKIEYKLQYKIKCRWQYKIKYKLQYKITQTYNTEGNYNIQYDKSNVHHKIQREMRMFLHLQRGGSYKEILLPSQGGIYYSLFSSPSHKHTQGL